ncbi:MAG TPA: FxLYD domain-containing protein, partial [Armatimonadota bacterium]
GKIKNNTNKSYAQVTLMYSISDSAGAQLGQVQGTIRNLGPGAETDYVIAVFDARASTFKYTGYAAMGG